MATYKVLIGMNYPPKNRAEIGDVVSDIPSGSIKWLLEDGAIELVESASKAKSKTSESEE